MKPQLMECFYFVGVMVSAGLPFERIYAISFTCDKTGNEQVQVANELLTQFILLIRAFLVVGNIGI